MSDVEDVDLLVVGGGKAGKSLAMDRAKAGWNVVMVERDKTVVRASTWRVSRPRRWWDLPERWSPLAGPLRWASRSTVNRRSRWRICGITLHDTLGTWKAVVDADTDRIPGAALLGHNSGEVLSVLQMAMLGGLPYQQLRDAVLTHPTMAEGVNLLFEALDDAPQRRGAEPASDEVPSG